MAEPKLPEVPAAQNVQVPAQPTIPTFSQPFQPMTSAEYLKLQQDMFYQQLGQMRPTMSAISELTTEYAPGMAQTRLDIEKEFGPQMAELYNQMLQQANPEFMSTYGALGEKVQAGLEAGYELGPELGTEVQQAIRAAQTARGNWLGGAPTAQEAFGMGSAAISLYNQRLGTAQNFLNSKQPTDMWGALQATSSYMPMAATFPQGSYPNAALSTDVFGQLVGSRASYNATAANAYGTYVGAQSANYGNYVQGLVGAAGVNNQSAFDRYSAQFDQFLYGQSVQQGLYSQPSAGGGGMGGMMGGLMGGIGSGISAGIGAAALGAGATGAIGAGVGAAASAAAAAICWVARKVVPDRWREFRRFLFTKAPGWFRTKYVTQGRSYSEKLCEKRDIERIRRAIERCLQS